MNEGKLVGGERDEGVTVNSKYPCQVCIHHENNPSRCILRDMHVSRKGMHACNEPSPLKVARMEHKE